MTNYKHEATFYSKILKKVFYCELDVETDFYTNLPIKYTVKVKEGTDSHKSVATHSRTIVGVPFGIGDSVSIEGVKSKVQIEDVIKHTDGSVEYYTSRIESVIINKDTGKTLAESVARAVQFNRGGY